MYALSQIARWLDGVLAILNENALDHVLLLLQSQNPNVWKWTCKLARRLAGNEVTTPAIVELNVSAPLVILARRVIGPHRDTIPALFKARELDAETRSSVILTLEGINEWLDGLAEIGDLRTRVQWISRLTCEQGQSSTILLDTKQESLCVMRNASSFVRAIGVHRPKQIDFQRQISQYTFRYRY